MEFFILLLAIYCLSTLVVIGKVVYECCQLGFKTKFEMKVCVFQNAFIIGKHSETHQYVRSGRFCLPSISAYH